jgi:predicted alpha/beta hydrolase family esterase
MEKPRHQAIFIRGGDTFDSKKQFLSALEKRTYDPSHKRRAWTDWLEWSLSEKFDSFTPLMPNKKWADYDAWKIWFEKVLPFINPDPSIKLIVIGQSLGSSFLVRYLSENSMPKKIDQLHLVAVMVDDLPRIKEQIANFRPNLELVPEIENKAKKIFMYHSKDDDLVPFKHSVTLKKYLKNAQFFEFEDRKHFSQPAFVELLQVINKNL